MNANILTWMIALPLAASPVIYLVGRIRTKNTNLGRWAGLLALLLTWIPFISAAREFTQNGPISYTLGAITLQMDGVGLLLAATALSLGTMVMIFSIPYMAGEVGEEKYFATLAVMVGSIMGLGCATELFNLWIWFETMAISSYMLVAFYHDQPASLEAGVKYLVQSTIGSILVLLGISLVYTQTGTLNIVEIRSLLQGETASPLIVVAGAFFVIGFGVKVALVPLHTWLPDAHSQAPSGISAMLSGVLIEAGLIALLRAISAISNMTLQWSALIMIFGAVNMLAGNLLALRQKQVKRLLAFSSLAHVGYMLVGLGVGIYFQQANGMEGSMFHLFNHAMMKGLAFLAAGSLLFALHTAIGDHNPLTIADLSGAAKRYPISSLTLSIAVLGLGGMPLLAGFMSKWQIFVGGFQTQSPLVYALVIFAALNSVLSLGYYAPLVNAVYRLEPSEAVKSGKPVTALMTIPMIIMALVIVVLGFYPALVNWMTGPAGAALLAAFAH
jgi:proton-translocating NADH-quinone oxidoreductase chain N